MANQQPNNEPPHVELGDYPFPLSNGPREAPYLTWLRDHSNYMLRRGLWDYLAIFSALARGVVVNYLIIMPVLLILAVAVSWVHISQNRPHTIIFEWGETREGTSGGGDVTGVGGKRQDGPSPGGGASSPGGGGGGSDRTVFRQFGFGDPLSVTVETNFGQKTTITIQDIAPPNAGEIGEFAVHLWNKVDSAKGWFADLRWTLEPEALVVEDARGDRVRIFIEQLEFDTRVTFDDRIFSVIPRPSNLLMFSLATLLIFLPIFERWIDFFPSLSIKGKRGGVLSRSSSYVLLSYVILVFAAVVLIEQSPTLLTWFHEVDIGAWVPLSINTISNIDARSLFEIFAATAGLVGGLFAFDRLLPAFFGVLQSVGIFLVGLIALIVPIITVAFIAEFLTFVNLRAYLHLIELPLVLIGVIATPLLLSIPVLFAMLRNLKSMRLRDFASFAWILIVTLSLFFVLPIGFIQVRETIPEFLFHYSFFAIAVVTLYYCWVAVDINQTSMHVIFRDRLSEAYLAPLQTPAHGSPTLRLQDICNYEKGSKAPYHLINTALNLQSSAAYGLRDRNSGFFVFSKLFVGSERTGFGETKTMEKVFPQLDLGTAMAISAAAAAPNMGRSTNRMIVAFLTLLNIRLGFWIPNPTRLENDLARRPKKTAHRFKKLFQHIFIAELSEISKRRDNAYGAEHTRQLGSWIVPTTQHEMVGLAFSGGGIRSATINLGVTQALHKKGILDHVDYMSSVSGGGYLAASISAAMRQAPRQGETSGQGAALGVTQSPSRLEEDSRIIPLFDSFRWRVRPWALFRELFSALDEKRAWVNLSDGGHIENTGAIELLRRRCKLVILGDGESDKEMGFDGLARLIRYARIDLGTEIELKINSLQLDQENNESTQHFAFGRIYYPALEEGGPEEEGYLLYLKSSLTGDEDQIIREYRNRNSDFPHDSTADQNFDDAQFEAYRSLGEHIANMALRTAPSASGPPSYHDLETWMITEAKSELDG